MEADPKGAGVADPESAAVDSVGLITDPDAPEWALSSSRRTLTPSLFDFVFPLLSVKCKFSYSILSLYTFIELLRAFLCGCFFVLFYPFSLLLLFCNELI